MLSQIWEREILAEWWNPTEGGQGTAAGPSSPISRIQGGTTKSPLPLGRSALRKDNEQPSKVNIYSNEPFSLGRFCMTCPLLKLWYRPPCLCLQKVKCILEVRLGDRAPRGTKGQSKGFLEGSLTRNLCWLEYLVVMHRRPRASRKG